MRYSSRHFARCSLPLEVFGKVPYRATEIQINLMETAARIMKLIDKTVKPDFNGQSGFLHHFAQKVIMQGCVNLDPAARCAPQMGAAFPGVDQQKPFRVHHNGTHGNPGLAGVDHG